MKKDAEVLLYMKERHKGTTQQLAAARAGMSERTARRYERAGKLPSQLKEPRTWCTRPNPFEQDWPWVVEQLQRDPALQGATLFALLCAEHPGQVSSDTSAHPATAHRHLESHTGTRARGVLRAGPYRPESERSPILRIWRI